MQSLTQHINFKKNWKKKTHIYCDVCMCFFAFFVFWNVCFETRVNCKCFACHSSVFGFSFCHCACKDYCNIKNWMHLSLFCILQSFFTKPKRLHTIVAKQKNQINFPTVWCETTQYPRKLDKESRLIEVSDNNNSKHNW